MTTIDMNEIFTETQMVLTDKAQTVSRLTLIEVDDHANII